jgi:hypothetical protein
MTGMVFERIDRQLIFLYRRRDLPMPMYYHDAVYLPPLSVLQCTVLHLGGQSTVTETSQKVTHHALSSSVNGTCQLR